MTAIVYRLSGSIISTWIVFTISEGTGQHSQMLRCFLHTQVCTHFLWCLTTRTLHKSNAFGHLYQIRNLQINLPQSLMACLNFLWTTYIGISSHFFCPRNYKINFEGFSPKFLSRVSNYSPQHRRIDVLYNWR